MNTRPLVLVGLVSLCVVSMMAQRVTSANPPRSAPRVGMCNVLRLVNELMMTGDSKEKLERHAKSVKDALEWAEAAVKRGQDKVNADPGAPLFADRIQLLNDQIVLLHQREWARQSSEDVLQHEFAKAYPRVVSAACAVAKEQGVTLLLQSSPASDNLPADIDSFRFLSDVMSRVVICAEATDDITQMVRERLKEPAPKP